MRASAFRLLHSIATALMASTNDWYLNIDKGKYTGLIFIDSKKPYDMVNSARSEYSADWKLASRANMSKCRKKMVLFKRAFICLVQNLSSECFNFA